MGFLLIATRYEVIMIKGAIFFCFVCVKWHLRFSLTQRKAFQWALKLVWIVNLYEVVISELGMAGCHGQFLTFINGARIV